MTGDVADWSRLSKTVSHALRHAPWLYELEPDEEGWVSTQALLRALRGVRNDWSKLDETALCQLVTLSEKRRHEIEGGRIRAYYGHSIPDRVSRIAGNPPSVLFHGTSPEFIAAIQREGLLPMKRQFVHLSIEMKTAIEVGSRKSRTPTILRVAAREAAAARIQFYEGNAHVWLADLVPARFLEVCGR